MQQAMPLKPGTSQPVAGHGGFPPFNTTTYPSQVFWLAITFVILLVFLSRFVVPRIGGTLAERKARIAQELAQAEQDRREADQAWTTYQNTLIEARARARTLIEENRNQVRATAERAEKAADSEADQALADAEARLAQLRTEARGHIRRAAEEAAGQIVERLIGEPVSPEDARDAVASLESR
ncbi:MAG TPA: F0F1 ATP synthase subunit B [Rhizomicrobium sp.]|jgi:F-type H+-transporting ATPase subunit b|nr:F0F1 ATP synthase subunit B [Rhizomicrobium sp.]